MIPGNKKPAFTLHDVLLYLAIGAKHARLMALIMCFSLCFGLTYYVFAKPVYYSRSLIRVEDLAQPLPLDTQKLYEDSRIHEVIAQLLSPHIRERTARALGVEAKARTLEGNYVFKVTATLNAEKNIEMEVWPWNAEWARLWSETLVREFLAYRLEKRIEDKQAIIKAYSHELKELVGKLDEQLSAQLDFKDDQDFTRSLILVNTLQSLPDDLSRLQKRIDEMGRVRVRLQNPSLDTIAKLSLISSVDDPDTRLNVGRSVETSADGEGKPADARNPGPSVVVIPSLVKSNPWDTFAQLQQQIEARIAEASRIYLPGHRKMAELTKQLETVNEQLEAELRTAETRFSLTYQEFLNEKRDLESKLPQYQELSRKHAKLLSQISIYDASRVPYATYVTTMKRNMESVQFAGEKERVHLRYDSLLDVRDTPVSPNRLKLVLLCLIAGVALSIGIPFLIEYLDHTLTNLEEVEHSFRLRGLGVVPQVGTAEEPGLVSHDDAKTGSLVENFRVIRTNVLSMGALTKQPHVVMVTSAMPKEGKTVISSNLASSFALTGAKTLLIDTDLRRGRLHRLFGYRKDPGLSNVLLGEITLDEACRPTSQENLTILSAGRHLEGGTELLGSPAFAGIMSELRTRYDRIIVDTPPVLGLSETSIMQSLVDGVLFVIWTGNTPQRGIKAAIEMLQSNGANFYGFVLNRLDLSTTQNYYQYYYYSHDYYYQNVLENA